MVAGLVDAGLASLATFVVGVYAVRALEPAILGGYALVYQAVFLVGIIPMNLVFVPVEVAVVARPAAARLAYLLRSLRLGAIPAALSGVAVTIWLPLAPPEIGMETTRALTFTGIALAILSPAQDHMRRMLHSGGRSWLAALVSTVQLGVAVGALVALPARGVAAPWIPFGALAMANLASLAVGVTGVRLRSPRDAPALPMRFSELARSGGWLVGGGLLNPVTGFASAAIVARLAGATALGYAEAARVVAQPVWVLAVGITSVLGPRSMEAGRLRRVDRARPVRRAFLVAILGAGALNLAWFGFDWGFNPLAWLLPAAYTIPGLVAVTIVAQVMGATIFPFRSELLGARRESTYTRVEMVGAAVRTAISATASVVHAFAIPIGYLAVWVVRWVGFRRALAGVYRESPRPEAEAERPQIPDLAP